MHIKPMISQLQRGLFLNLDVDVVKMLFASGTIALSYSAPLLSLYHKKHAHVHTSIHTVTMIARKTVHHLICTKCY